VLTVDLGATQADWSADDGGLDPADRLAELAGQLERIPLPKTLVKSVHMQTPSRALIRLRGRLREAVVWLRGGKDAFGLSHSPDDVGRILCGTVEDSAGDKQWSAGIRAAIGPKTWPQLLDILKNVNALARSLLADAGE